MLSNKRGEPARDEAEIAIIQQTDVDAKVAKRSAAALRYLNDPFIESFVPVLDRKSPIINRGKSLAVCSPWLTNKGTYVRTRSIDRLIDTVVQANPHTTTQIVSLGAGTDTRFFNLQTRLGIARSIRYHEFDFQKVASAKARVIADSPRLFSLVHKDVSQVSIDVNSGCILSPTYSLHSMDIRKLPLASQLPPYLQVDLPTIFISECCLIYMDIEHASSLLTWASQTFQGGVGVILYEPIGGHDAFGRMMVRNLATRGINLKTLSAYPTLETESMRLRQCGFTSGQDAINVNVAHDYWMGDAELQRIAKIELLDELEEWRLLASHYCIAWGWKRGPDPQNVAFHIFDGWDDIKGTVA